MKKLLQFSILFALTVYSENKPNILFISIDDLNDFPAYMEICQDAKTPNMDRLAGKGIYFTKAHSPYPLCGPARASIMTGFRPSTLDISWHVGDSAVVKKAENLGGKALHTYFSENGYKTMAVGKVFQNYGGWQGFP